MKYDADDLPGFVPSLRYAPYNSSLASSASASTASVWSDASSQSSDDASTTSSDSESCEYYCHSKQQTLPETASLRRPQPDVVPADQRQNPRRTAAGAGPRGGCPPPLIRQSDRKVNFVDSLVDSSTQIVEAIWPLSSVVCRSELGSKAVLPLRTFIQETLRRSRTSYSTLQVALYYLILIKPHVPKHNFTMEQPGDRYADRSLQCGRRMFLAALILASKYLQDRNYSARAWSRISGLNTQEIHQNEIAFLLAVNWKLHIADEVFQRWTEIVLKYTPPPSPPSPGGIAQPLSQASLDWRYIILGLNSELTNIDSLVPTPPQFGARASDLSPVSPRSILNMSQDSRYDQCQESAEATPVPRSCPTPVIMEPTPTSVYTHGRLAPTLGMLPTPRLTPQPSGFCTPAASAASQMLGRHNSMGLAMSQANTVNAMQYLDRPPMSVSSSPQSYFSARRSSLANSVSTASSPESMISDTSRTSRSSSISSASSLASATANSKLSVPLRFRASKQCLERVSLKPSVPSVPEDYDEHSFSSSPESYTGPVGKLEDFSAETPLGRFENRLDAMVGDADSDAARALQELHSQYADAAAVKTGAKRSRPSSIDNALHENVRDMLSGRYSPGSSWPDTLLRSRAYVSEPYLQVPVRSDMSGSRKRVCCSAEATNGYEKSAIHSGMGMRGQALWQNILN
jgi:hypothetical protein